MLLCSKTLEKLRDIINADGQPNYRSGPKLVAFFNALGFQDRYRQGFPSRWIYTDEKLKIINGTPELDKCIKNAFAVIDYIGRIDELDSTIADFNQYLAFDKWKLIRDNENITFQKLDKVVVKNDKPVDFTSEDYFLKQTFIVDISQLGLESFVSEIISKRLKEVEICVRNDAPLSSVIMIGSILEGILLGIATSYPQIFNRALCAPKDKEGNVLCFQKWTLNSFIEVASEIGFLKEDVKKFSQVVRDFRNYIHPYSQMSNRFSPDKQTALICFQVLKAAIFQISEHRKSL